MTNGKLFNPANFFMLLAFFALQTLSAKSVAKSVYDVNPSITFTLINADTDQDIGPLTNGAVINLATLPTTNLNVRANTAPTTAGSVKFGYDNTSNYQVESSAPFALAGDSNGDYNNWTPSVGSHTLVATSFSGNGASGSQLASLTVNFTVTNNSNVDCNGVSGGSASVDDCGVCAGGNTGKTANADKDACGVCFGDGSSCAPGSCSANDVTGFMLIQANSTTELGALTNGMTINKNTLGSFSIRADVCNDQAGSVEFFVNGNSVQMENVAPFAINGDGAGGYNAWNPSPGSYTLKAVATSSSNGNGSTGNSLTINFTVVDNNSTTTDCNGDANGTAFIDDCGACAGGNTGKTPNADKDNCGVCFGDGSSCAPSSCSNYDVTGFMLIKASTDNEIGPLTNGMTIDKSQIGSFSVRADVCNDNAESLEFFLNGNSIQMENVAPYSVAGDGAGGYNAWNISAGSYTLKATAYKFSNGNGTTGQSLTVNFTVVDNGGGTPTTDCNGDANGTASIDDCGVCAGGNTGKTANADKDNCGVCFGDGSSCAPPTTCSSYDVTGFMLIKASTDNEIGPLTNGMTIDRSQTGNFSVRADVCNNSAGSLEFFLNGNSIQMENVAPYSVAGDGAGGYKAWNIPAGTYTLKAVAYSGSNGNGSAGSNYTLTFTVVDNGGGSTTTDCHGDVNGTASLDDCGVCAGGNTGKTANADKDNCGVCFGDGSSCATCQNLEVVGFTLVYDGNRGTVGPLTNGQTIDKDNVGGFSIVAEVCDKPVGSVEFEVNSSVVQVEGSVPYAIAGDGSGGFTDWNPAPGSYTLTATPYQYGNANGQKGISKTINFTVTGTGGGNNGGGSPGGSASNLCGQYPGGKIALVHDGNQHDPDDFVAMPMAMAILEAAGLNNKVSYIGHSCHIGNSSSSMEQTMVNNAAGAAQRFGYSNSIIYNINQNPTSAANALAAAINAASSSSPLWILAGGPMEIVWRGLNQAQVSQRKYVKVVSHSVPNNNHDDTPQMSNDWDDMKSDFQGNGTQFILITDQNYSDGANDFKGPKSYWSWMNTSGNSEWQWLYSRNQTTAFDASDAGMAMWLATGGTSGGDERAGWPEVKDFFENPCSSYGARVQQQGGGINESGVDALRSGLGENTQNPDASETETAAPASATSSSESLAGGEMDIYPNPSRGQFTLSFPEAVSGEVQVRIYSQTGQLVHRIIENHGTGMKEQQVDGSGLAPGFYLVEANSPKRHFKGKIVIN